MSSNNAHKRKARVAQRETGESYMRARHLVDDGESIGERLPEADDSDLMLGLLGLTAPPSPPAITALWAARDLPAGTGERVQRDTLLTIPLGADASGQPLWLDLKEAAYGGQGPHSLIAGITGSGKTALLQSISMSLCVSHSPQVLQLAIVDNGRGGFDDFTGYPNAAVLPETAVAEAVASRMEALRSAHVASLTEYQSLRAAPEGADLPAIPYMVVVIDGADHLYDRKLLEILWRQGRSVGIHTLSATGSLDTLPSLSNVTCRIALKTGTVMMSYGVIGSEAAFNLAPTPGAGLLTTPGSDAAAQPFQGYRVSRQALRTIGRWLAHEAAAKQAELQEPERITLQEFQKRRPDMQFPAAGQVGEFGAPGHQDARA